MKTSNVKRGPDIRYSVLRDIDARAEDSARPSNVSLYFELGIAAFKNERATREGKVADQLRVSVGQVYLARHRVGAVLKKEIKALEKSGR